MKLDVIKGIAMQQNIKVGKLKKAELVRAIQLTEGNEPCFGSGRASECDQAECLWRVDCN